MNQNFYSLFFYSINIFCFFQNQMKFWSCTTKCISKQHLENQKKLCTLYSLYSRVKIIFGLDRWCFFTWIIWTVFCKWNGTKVNIIKLSKIKVAVDILWTTTLCYGIYKVFTKKLQKKVTIVYQENIIYATIPKYKSQVMTHIYEIICHIE